MHDWGALLVYIGLNTSPVWIGVAIGKAAHIRGDKMKERTMVFWVGLILFSLASVVLFGIVWIMIVSRPPHDIIIKSPLIPAIVGGIVFLVIGIWMMKSGKKEIL